MKVPCPHCGGDWIHRVSHPDFDRPLYWCPEEDTLWFSEENLFKDTQMFGVSYTNYHSYQDLIGDPTWWEKTTDLGEFERGSGS